jgi:hypothetical protein
MGNDHFEGAVPRPRHGLSTSFRARRPVAAPGTFGTESVQELVLCQRRCRDLSTIRGEVSCVCFSSLFS